MIGDLYSFNGQIGHSPFLFFMKQLQVVVQMCIY